jgi:hypothetical protein
MGYCPGEVYDSDGRMVNVETRSARRIELSILGDDVKVWSTLDEASALTLLNHFVAVCNGAFGTNLNVE